MAPSNTSNSNQEKPLCFVIGPYGERGSQTRQWSDFLFEKVVAPVLCDRYRVQRTIDSPESGQITGRIKRDLQNARIVIADLTADNPNVYYELGFRHALKTPFVHVVRANGPKLPFDIQGFETIPVNADYVESQGYYAIRDGDLRQAQESLRTQIEKIGERPSEDDSGATSLPVSAKVYRWNMFYSPRIADDWLGAQPDTVRKQIESYETGGGTDSVTDASLPFFAEYLALKSAASLSGDGTIFMVFNNGTRTLDFGHAVFKFSSAPEPILIDITDVSCSGNGVGAITFKQESRPFPVERGGRAVEVRIPGYMYTLQISISESDGIGRGEIVHPNTMTTIGKAVLRPRYGALFR